MREHSYFYVPEFLVIFENLVNASLGWPQWVIRIISFLSLIIFVVNSAPVLISYLFQCFQPIESAKKAVNIAPETPTWKFRLFQLQYLSVYLIIMLADWLQGTNMYTLYSSYNVSVGSLFLTGFLSSALFGTFLGIFVDSWGRKFGCIVFCILEVVINLLEHIPSMPVLMFGRVLGGLSTSLLFTTFESWMVSEHRKRGFSEKWISSTFSISSWGNGFMAICAGFLAQIAADINGDIGPFQLAIVLTIVALVMILFWDENYGATSRDEKEKEKQKEKEKEPFSSPVPVMKMNLRSSARKKKTGDDDGNSAYKSKLRSNRKASKNLDQNETNGEHDKNMYQLTDDNNINTSTSCSNMIYSMKSSIELIKRNPAIMYLGLSQAFFEGAMYTFVFMWVPSMLNVTSARGEVLPTGLVFSSFMLSMTLGGMLFGILLPIFPRGAEDICLLTYFISALSMIVPILYFEFWPVTVCFLVFEAMVGMFNSAGGTLRSKLYPEDFQSSIMSVFRLPLNALVVLGTKLTDTADTVESLQFVFGIVVMMHIIACLFQLALSWTLLNDASSKKDL